MVQLKFVGTDANKTPIGILNWYAVHLTSMNNTKYERQFKNHFLKNFNLFLFLNSLYISGDNKGYAQLQFEARINGDDVMPGKVRF